MLFMNIARKFGRQVYQEEAGGETSSPVAAAPATEPAPVEEDKPGRITLGDPAKP